MFHRLSGLASGPGRSAAGLLVFAVALAGCTQTPAQKSASKEYFPSSVYGAASPRVVADGEAVPRGGGRYLVGKPYTIAGRVYTPKEVSLHASQTGSASWYGGAFHGRRTSNGEVYDMRSVTAAHPTWPLPSYVRVTNIGNGRSMIVRLNDRGPFHANRIMDVSSAVADALDFKRMGTAKIKIDYVGKAGLAGSDDQILMASLRTDGKPANLDNTPGGQPTMIAEAPAAAPEPQRGSLASIFQSRPEPQEETTVVSRQESEESAAPVAMMPAPRPASLRSAQLAEAREAAGGASHVTSFASVASTLPEMPPLPPVRPVSLDGGRATR